MTANIDMTKGSVWKNIILFALPIFISSLFQNLYTIVDSLIVGNYLGDECLASVSGSGYLIYLFTSFFIGCFSGAGVVISKYFGERNEKNMRKAIHTDIIFALLSAILLTVVGIILSPYILEWMNTDPEVLPNSVLYFRWYFILVIGTIMYNCFSSILQAVGNSTMPLIFLIIACVLNVGLDLLFIAGFHMSVDGASIASGISQIISALLCFIYLLRKKSNYQIKFNEFKLDGNMFKLILKYGLPSGLQNSVIGIANVIVQSNINTFGKVAMTGCGIYSKIEGFAFLPVTSFTLALTTFTGQNLGAKEYDRAKKGAKFGIITSMLLAVLIGITLYFIVPYLAMMFTSTEEVINITVTQARTIMLFYAFLAFSHCAAAILRGAGKPILPMVVMFSIWCGVRIIYIYTAMSIAHEIVLIFWAYPITWMISSIIYLLMLIFSDWIHGFDKKKLVKNEIIIDANSEEVVDE